MPQNIEYWESQLEKMYKLCEQLRLFWYKMYAKLLKARKIDAALAYGIFGRLIRPIKYDADEAREWVGESMERDGNVKVAKIMIPMCIREIENLASTSKESPEEPTLNLKTCPYCAETIKAAAIVCRYCGRDLPS